MSEVKRQPVDYRHDAINPEFLQFLARIAGYATIKYGDPLQYLGARLKGGTGPVNHARNHIGQYQMGEAHDHFGNDPRWQLAAAAYNLMMEFVYVSRGETPDTWPVVTGAVHSSSNATVIYSTWKDHKWEHIGRKLFCAECELPYNVAIGSRCIGYNPVA